MADQQFCLRWNNYQENLTRILDRLLQNEALVDVTLYIGGKSIRAHKTILSACSPYFEKMFMENTHPHPIVVLRDFDYDNVKGLLDFMYKGEVNVTQERLGSFIKTAETLEVRGLANDIDKKKSSQEDFGISHETRLSSPAVKRRRRSSYDSSQEDSNQSGNTYPISSNQDVHTQRKSHFSSDVSSVYDSNPVSPLASESQSKPKPPIVKTEAPSPSLLPQSDPIPPTAVQPVLTEHQIDQVTDLPIDSKPLPDTEPANTENIGDHSGEHQLPVIKEENMEEGMEDDEPELLEVYSNLEGDSNSGFLETSGDGELLPPSGVLPFQLQEGAEGTSSGFTSTMSYFQQTPDQQFSCLLCGALLKYSRSLSKHLDIHRNKRFFCPVCGKAYTQKGHMRIHYFKNCVNLIE